MTRSIVKLSYLITTSLIAGSYLSACWADGIPTVNLDLGKPGAPVAATFYGLMTEEINYSYEGGIYAELIQNRIFRDNTAAPAHWAVVQDGGGKGAISLDESQPIPGTVLARCLKLDASQASPGHRAGIANDGYWGMSRQTEDHLSGLVLRKVRQRFPRPAHGQHREQRRREGSGRSAGPADYQPVAEVHGHADHRRRRGAFRGQPFRHFHGKTGGDPGQTLSRFSRPPITTARMETGSISCRSSLGD